MLIRRLSRRFARAGALVLIAAACVLAYGLFTRAVALSVLGVVFLLPLSLLLLGHGFVWFCLARRYRSAPRGAAVAGVLLSLAGASVAAVLMFWGFVRSVDPPAVTMQSLVQASRASALSFPSTTKLVDGEIKGGWQQYFILKASMPAAHVQEFLDMQNPPFEWSSITGRMGGPALALPVRADIDYVLGLMDRRGWELDVSDITVFAKANSAPTPGNVCWVMAPKVAGDTAIIYVFWADT